jgi:hypothetical protein
MRLARRAGTGEIVNRREGDSPQAVAEFQLQNHVIDF